jgi:hypothetical protein
VLWLCLICWLQGVLTPLLKVINWLIFLIKKLVSLVLNSMEGDRFVLLDLVVVELVVDMLYSMSLVGMEW